MREIGISPRFSRDKFVPLQTKQRYSTRDISSEVFLTLFFRGFVPFLSLADFVSRDKNLQVVDLQRLKSCFGELVTATTSNHQNGPSYGIFFAMMKRHGFFLHASSDLRTIGNTEGNCQKDGSIDANGTKPYLTGETRHSNYTLTLGAIHHISRNIRLFEGIGYGRCATAWQRSESEGGGYLLNEGLTHKGISAEAGVLASFNRFTMTASTITIAGKQWEGCIGLGIKIF